jgi:hypothetical protein
LSTKEVQQELVKSMKDWRELENATVAITARAMEKTQNSIIRLIMEVIQSDSQMHYRVQEWISDSIESKAVSLTPEEIGDVWSIIEKHIELEKKSVAMAEQTLATLKGKSMVVQSYLLNYLLQDENKHVNLLTSLDNIKKKMYPYG